MVAAKRAYPHVGNCKDVVLRFQCCRIYTSCTEKYGFKCFIYGIYGPDDPMNFRIMSIL